MKLFADRTNWNFAANRLSEALAQRRSSGAPVFDLTASNPTLCGFHYNGEVISAALTHPAIFTYSPDPRGLEFARAAVAHYYAQRGVTVSLDSLFLTASTTEAYSFALRVLCNPGDEVLIPAPSYPLFDFLADVQDVKLVRYPLFYDHGWHIDFHALGQAITSRTRAIIVVHPNNPTGHFTRASEVAQLNAVCARHDVALIADEVFLDFALGDSVASTFAGNPGALTFTMSGISKIAGLPQMKLAWLAVSGPDAFKTAALQRLEVIADTFLSVNTPVQVALPVLLDTARDFQEQVRLRVKENLATLDAALPKQHLFTRLEVEGGWHAVLRLPAGHSDESFALRLLTEDGVYVHPGHFFDFPRDGYLVVSLIAPPRDLQAAIAQISP